MKNSTTRKLGTKGEDHATRYLYEMGYDIVVRNWRCKVGEIDLIAIQDDELVFIEVRSRQGNEALNQAAESITPKKQERLLKLAEIYTAENPHENIKTTRIDVLVIALDGENGTIEHYQNAVGW